MSTAFSQNELRGLIEAFKDIPEYRKKLLNVRHKLGDIIVISVCGVIAGADGPTAIYEWAEVHEEQLTRILKLKFGIPSKDTIRRTLQAIQPEAFQKCFLERVDIFRAANACEKEHIAIDGKTLRRSHDAKNALGTLHIVSAYSTGLGISLGQLRTAAKSNEITAIPDLLDSLALEGSVISIDAQGTQTKIAEKIVAKKAGYVLAEKESRPKLLTAIKTFFADVSPCSKRVCVFVKNETSHGRTERREYRQATVPPDFFQKKRWAGLQTVGMVTRCFRRHSRHRKLAPLGAGHGFPRGRKPRPRTEHRRQPVLGPPFHHHFTQTSPVQTQPRRQTPPRRLELRFPHGTHPRNTPNAAKYGKITCAGPAVGCRWTSVPFRRPGESSRRTGCCFAADDTRRRR